MTKQWLVKGPFRGEMMILEVLTIDDVDARNAQKQFGADQSPGVDNTQHLPSSVKQSRPSTEV
jgi:hypothetical protein